VTIKTKSINRLDVHSDNRLAMSQTEPNITSSEEAKSKFRTHGDSIRNAANA